MEQVRILERLKEQRKVLDKAIKSLEEAIDVNKKEAAKIQKIAVKPQKPVEKKLIPNKESK